MSAKELEWAIPVRGDCDKSDARNAKSRMLKRRSAIRDLSIIAPVHVRKNVVPPFAVAQKFFIEIICDKLIVQTVEASKVIDRALSGVFARSPGFH